MIYDSKNNIFTYYFCHDVMFTLIAHITFG